MFPSNAPKDYVCPICLGVQGVVNDLTLMRPGDVVFQDEKVTAFVNSFFMGKNAGHVIVVPNKHFENLYSIPKQKRLAPPKERAKYAQKLKAALR